MKRILLLCCFAMGALIVRAQKIYFVYLQTENNEPFFVRMDDKLYSSSASGYLILPRLLDSTYNFRLGFPGKAIDLGFSTTINRRDHGYLIKNFGEKGWGLFDLQSLGIQMSSTKINGTADIDHGNTQVDAFTELLSKAADDPSLKQNVVLVKQEEKKPMVVETVQKEEKKPEVTEAVVKEQKKTEPPNAEKTPGSAENVTDNKTAVAARVSGEKKTEVIPVPDDKSEGKNKVADVATHEKQIDSTSKISEGVKTEEVYRRSQVTRISAGTTKEGFESVFVDQQNGRGDTIRILIPAAKNEAVAKEEIKRDSATETKKFLEIEPDAKQMSHPDSVTKKDQPVKWWPFGNPFAKKDKESAKNKKKDAEPAKTQPESKSQVTEKNTEPKKWNLFGKNKASTNEKKCELATHDDFLKLRRRMAEKTNDDGMLEEARKYFKERCFTTEQIKNLSSMFLSNASKYNFFELAHNKVTDKENFSSLQSELKDEYYVGRFKTLVGN